MGGAGDARSGAAYLRSGFRGAVDAEEVAREEGMEPLVAGREWLLLLLARWLRLARAEEGWGRGLLLLGGGGVGAAAADATALDSFVFEEAESDLLVRS